jgi:Tat protein secretion system quality control protein TatD with DNase activity
MTTPSFIPPVVGAIAQIKNKKESDVADQLIKNFNQFFGTTLV